MSQTNITIDSSNNRHIVYKEDSGLFYGYSNSDKFTQQWEIEPIHGANINENVGSYNSLAIDSDNTIHISYCYVKSTESQVCYAYRTVNGTWQFPTNTTYGGITETFLARGTTAPATSAPTCILIGSTGGGGPNRVNIFFAGYDSSPAQTASYGLRYIYSDDSGATWVTGGVPGGYQLTDWLSATSASSKLIYRGCSSHFAAIQHYGPDADNDMFYFSFRDPSENTIVFNSGKLSDLTAGVILMEGAAKTVTDCSGSPFIFHNTSIAYNQTYDELYDVSNIHILTQTSPQELKYLHTNDGGDNWDGSGVILKTWGTGGYGGWSSMVADKRGQVQVVYAFEWPLDYTKLYYLKRNLSGIWDSSIIIDSQSSAGTAAKNRIGICSSIAFDINDLPHISYYNTDIVGTSAIGGYSFPTIKYNRLLGNKSLYMFKYVPEKTGIESWIEMQNMPSENYGFALVPVNEKLYAIGGADIESNSKDTTWLYDPKCDVWQESATTNILDVSRTYLNAISVDISGAVGGTVVTLGGWDISENTIDASGRKLLGDTSHNICSGEKIPVGEGYRGQEATTSYVTDVSGNDIINDPSGNSLVNNDPFLPPYAVFTYIIKYA